LSAPVKKEPLPYWLPRSASVYTMLLGLTARPSVFVQAGSVAPLRHSVIAPAGVAVAAMCAHDPTVCWKNPSAGSDAAVLIYLYVPAFLM
jgi:hypothetical protein